MTVAAATALLDQLAGAVYSRGQLAVLDQIVAPGFVNHAEPARSPGPAGVKEAVTELRTAFPDLRATVQVVQADGTLVVAQWTFVGAQSGAFLAVAPTHRAVRWTGTATYRLQGGQLREAWVIWDEADLLRQLGVLSGKTRVIRPREQAVITAVKNEALPSQDLAYTEAKAMFERQAKQIDTITGRATWLVATAFGVVFAVGGRASDIAKLDLHWGWIAALVAGVVLAVLAAGLGIVAAWLRTYQQGLTISRLQEEFQWWDPVHAKVQWLADFRAMFEQNDRALQGRIQLMVLAGVVMLAAIAELVVVSSVIVIWQAATH
jgi:predicted ester cyclase